MALKKDTEDYDAHRNEMRDRQAAESRTGRDIADKAPDCVNIERRQTAADSLEYFCRIYFPQTFNLPWSNDHRTAIGLIERAVREGGDFAYAMPRGSGKTTLAESAALWATLFGYRRFVVPIGSDQGSALEMLESIKVELESNDALNEDFHWACHPIRKLDGIAHRCNGQLWNGDRTHIHWTKEAIVLPTIPGSAASGAIITVAGLTGRVRGMKFKRPDGQSARPDFAILDDPQTDESARSPSQVAQRERLISGAVLGLAGPGRKIAAVMPCTVIAPGDVADRFLDQKKHPEWQGARAKLVYAFPPNEDLWEKYASVRADSLRAGNGGAEATEFYRANREAMDAGSQVAWPARHNPDELSALQHAMNLKLDLGEAAFAAEYQNEPLVEKTSDNCLTATEIAAKVNGIARGRVPVGCNHLTSFIDVQGKLLFWLVAAWEDNFTGYIIDYGAFPDQRRSYYTARDARHTLKANGPKGAGIEGQIFAGLEKLSADLLKREWKRDDGAAMRIGQCLVDANWGESTETVYKFCRQTPHAAVVMPSHGKYIGVSSTPWEQYTRKPGERLGHHWLIPSLKNRRAVRHLLIDTNFWKTFVHARLSTATADHGCLSLFGKAGEDHRMLSEHLTAEYGVQVEGRGRKIVEWKERPGRPDNHWLDCLVGCAAAASMQGVQILSKPAVAKAARRRRAVSYL